MTKYFVTKNTAIGTLMTKYFAMKNTAIGTIMTECFVMKNTAIGTQMTKYFVMKNTANGSSSWEECCFLGAFASPRVGRGCVIHTAVFISEKDLVIAYSFQRWLDLVH